jgi:IPT/TIG domain
MAARRRLACTNGRPFDGTHGALAQATPMQPSNGRIYVVTERGNANGLNQGVLYRLDNAAPPSVLLTTVSGTAGQTVQILAGGLTGTSKVKFGSATARFHVVSDTFLTATVPNNGTTGLVSVTTRSRTLVSNRKFFVLPVISSFTPTSGPVGTQVIINIVGTGLLGATQVKFGSVKATSFTVNSATSITASVLSGSVTGKVSVTTPGGTAMSQAAFT